MRSSFQQFSAVLRGHWLTAVAESDCCFKTAASGAIRQGTCAQPRFANDKRACSACAVDYFLRTVWVSKAEVLML